jgi:C-terminal processing protease CtpA/Prc
MSKHRDYWRVQVADRSPAEVAGAKPLDLVVAIDGADARGLPHEEVMDLLSPPLGTRVEVELDRDGERFLILLQSVELL